MGLLKSFVQNGLISGLNIQQNRIKEQSKLVVVGNFLLYLLELMDEMRWARNAFATSFDNSDDQRLVVIIRSRGTQRA